MSVTLAEYKGGAITVEVPKMKVTEAQVRKQLIDLETERKICHPVGFAFLWLYAVSGFGCIVDAITRCSAICGRARLARGGDDLWTDQLDGRSHGCVHSS